MALFNHTQASVHACAWCGRVICDLGVHNDFYTYPFGKAVAVNDNNRIAGNSFAFNSHYRDFILDATLP